MKKHHHDEENPFSLSIGDLMAATLFVFVLLLSAALLNMKDQTDKLDQQNKTIKEITQKYEDRRKEIQSALETHFGDQLTEWGAEIVPNQLCVRFSEQSMFLQSSSRVEIEFQKVLDEFFPKYIKLLKHFEDDIAEMRIEGHTNSDLYQNKSAEESYFENMKLSQERSKKVLEYCYKMANSEEKKWLEKYATANGLSSSHPILIDGLEDRTKSRRVEFRIMTKSEDNIKEITNTLQK